MHDIQEKNHRPLPKEPDQDAEITIKDPLAALQEKAAENLSRIKLVNVRDILNAFKDKDHLGGSQPVWKSRRNTGIFKQICLQEAAPVLPLWLRKSSLRVPEGILHSSCSLAIGAIRI